MHGSNDVVELLIVHSELNGLGPSGPVMRNAAIELASLREEVVRLRKEVERMERYFGHA
jgi:hypothetical protein